jgi:hypothetical protein
VEIKDISLETVEQEKKKIEEAPTILILLDMMIEIPLAPIIDILQEITTLPIVLTLEIETDLETGTITNPIIIIIDLEVEANLVIGIDLEIVLQITTGTTDPEADLLLLILGMSILLIPLMILPMKNLKLS